MKKSDKKVVKSKRSLFWDDENFAAFHQSRKEYKLKINVIPVESSEGDDNSNSLMKNLELFQFDKKSPAKDKQLSVSAANSNQSPRSSAPISETESNSMNIQEEKTEKNELGADPVPIWAQGSGIRDKKLRGRGDIGYDPTTLHIPNEDLNKMTPAMRQYWQIKSEYFDKIILFKYGNFYETYYEDSIICHKELDLAWVGKKLNVGFPEKSLEKHAFTLVNKGYRLCLVEQIETPNQMKERVKFQERGKKDRVIKREVIQILTRGTVLPPFGYSGQIRYLLSVGKWDNIVGFALFELSKLEIQVGYFLDDENSLIFKNFYEKFYPVELVINNQYLPTKLKNVIEDCQLKPDFSLLEEKRLWLFENLKKEIQDSFKKDEKLPFGLQEILQDHSLPSDSHLKALSGLIFYLKEVKLFPRIFPICKFSLYDLSTHYQSRMVLDSNAIQSLNVIDYNPNSIKSASRSLFDYINRTVSKFGKRLLNDWVQAPLVDPEKIEERLESIRELAGVDGLITKIQYDIKRLPDLEKKCTRISMLGTQTGDKIVSFENISEYNLRDFKTILENFIEARTILRDLDGFGFKSNLLKGLIEMKFGDQESYEVEKIVLDLSSQIVWEGSKQDIPTPRVGLDKDYDEARRSIEDLESSFQKYLVEIQERYNNDKRICFAHVRHRYELEFPSELVEGSKKPKDFEFSSKKQGFERFVTAHIKSLVQELELLEEQLKICLNEFTISLFKQFSSHSRVWDRLILCVAMLDCLCSLSLVSFENSIPMCKPNFLKDEGNCLFNALESVHPLVLESRGAFVSNDITINNGIILLTGPNMGGKSTILRQVSLIIIMAQIGCYVPAKECTLHPVDRIFTRIGAYDDIMNNKSTFFVEMEDISSIIKYASKKSFVVIDELGRGTSTFDGSAIAYSVLKHLANNIGCRGIFSTHYFDLVGSLVGIPNIYPYHMLTKVSTQEDKIQFLYKLIEGKAKYNFAFNVASLAGVEKSILKLAQEKKESFDCLIESRKLSFKLTKVIEHIQSHRDNTSSDFDKFFSDLSDLLG